jgi:cytochrome bd-type quinol oxidase subunit 2
MINTLAHELWLQLSSLLCFGIATGDSFDIGMGMAKQIITSESQNKHFKALAQAT